MVICGIKLTHDGAITIIDNGKLIFCYEMEKIGNNNRFSALNYLTPSYFNSILNKYGYSLHDVDRIVIDGWGQFKNLSLSDDDYPSYTISIQGWAESDIAIELSRYGQSDNYNDFLTRIQFEYPEQGLSYSSYYHVSSHIMGAYCTGPFARRNEDSFVLVWDGGMCPQLFYFDAVNRKVENLKSIFSLTGNIYSAFASSYPPFNTSSPDDLSVAGKVMAYIAKGRCVNTVLNEFDSVYKAAEAKYISSEPHGILRISQFTTSVLLEFASIGEFNNINSVDMLATFHVFVQQILVERLRVEVAKHPSYKRNLCFAGGCALNIKWNSSIRNSGIFNEMWVPPFPNDSGSAIGTACCEMVTATDNISLEWDVYSGPPLNDAIIENDNRGWKSLKCDIKELANILHKTDNPVVFLNGRAELGPRALGNRSIFASAISLSMKTKLNDAKLREEYRPVAPICLEEAASSIFIPGYPDPLMLYEHYVNEKWLEIIPAVCHLDGSARLQTVNAGENKEVYELLFEYNKLSGVPLLCNTSANFNGKGFFPDVKSAMEWGKVDIIWSNNLIFVKRNSVSMDLILNILSKDEYII